ncbi:restriction endonuclease subunit S [Vibrio aestuarianus]|uniref:restriction endonuclease subunit S n=1 Tax=Vibrio aestuarianus TaxID=28171 RepID=UPI001593777E|nr:restriction endonuclease subunit S [Vibrio aestuarianus]NGZ17088.1 restriction endonuclease subunit S [Vibrio aestuarianus]
MVPNGWEKSPVGKLCKSIVPGRNKPKVFDGDIPWVTTPEISGKYIPSAKQKNYISQSVAKECGAKIVPKGAVIIAAVGELGLTAIAKEEIILNQQLHAFVCPPNVNNEYLAYFLSAQKPYMDTVASKTTIPYMNKSNCESIPVLLPPLSEQHKIAQILSTWDRGIATTEKLIDASKQQKKALMQQLLTGKKRLGCAEGTYTFKKTRYGSIPTDWAYPAIKDIAVQKSEKNNEGLDLPVLSCSKYDGFVDSLKYFKKKVYSDDTSGYRIISKGCFGFPANHIEEGSIGLQNLYEKGIVSPIYVVFQAKKDLVENRYLYALLKTDHYRQIFSAATNASVDRRGSLRWKEFSAIHVSLPPLEEQKAIADVLELADKETKLLEAKLAHLKQEKKALMQQLLTGKRRVKVNEVA